jgi:hypothetical protein
VDGRYGPYFQPALWDSPLYVTINDKVVVLGEKVRRKVSKMRKVSKRRKESLLEMQRGESMT